MDRRHSDAAVVCRRHSPHTARPTPPPAPQVSDRTHSESRFFPGKRRLWMWCGMLGLSLSSITMAFSPNIGLLLGDPDDAALLAETALPETGSGAAHALPPTRSHPRLSG